MRAGELIPFHAAEITGFAFGDLAQHVEAHSGGLPLLDRLAHSERFRYAENTLIVGDLILAAGQYLAQCGKSALEVDISTFFLDAGHYGQIYSRVLRALDIVIDILDNKEFQFLSRFRESLVVGPAVSGIRAEDPQALDLSCVDSLHDHIVGNRGLLRDMINVDAGQLSDPCSLIFIREITASEQAGGITEETGGHGVALSGNGVAAGTGLSDIPGHQSQIDNGLRCAHCLVALVDAHGPPERDSLAIVDEVYEFSDLLRGKACSFHSLLKGEVLHECRELVELIGVLFNELVIDPVLLDQHVGDRIHQLEIAPGL